jgi:ATP-binding cassette subfamily B protein
MRELIRFIFDSTAGYRKLISYGCFSMFLVAIVDNIQPYFVKQIIDSVAANNYSNIWMIVIGFIISQATIFLAWSLFDHAQYRYSPSITADINCRMLSQISSYPYRFFQNNLSGQISAKISNLGINVTKIIDFVTVEFFHHGLQVLFSVILITKVHKFLGIGMLIWLILFFYVIKLMSPKAEELASESAEIESKCHGKIVDYLSNIFSVKIFSTRDYEEARLKEDFAEYKQKQIHKGIYLRKFYNVEGRIFSIYLISLLVCMIYLAKNNLITAGDFALVFMLNFTVVEYLFNFIWRIRELISMIGTCTQALETLEEESQIEDIKDAPDLKVTKGKIVFKNVKFHYKNASPLFNNKSVIINPGEKVGLVGYSGSGKSTFTSLILRLYDVTNGYILIDEQDIAKVTQDSLRKNIALIPQDPTMFHRSLMENIRYGRLDATNEEVIEAAKKAHAHEFIIQMLDGYDALVGERGIKLSGGQRQRIVIARAILKNAPILILDEATSQLDSITENKIGEALIEVMKDKASIVIAHRLSTIMNMDRILVFDNGKIVEDGTYEELLSKNGLFKQMWEAQTGGLLPAKKETL